MITEDYVSFETAKLLKEKGFDLPVNYVYHYWTKTPFFHRKIKNFNSEEYRNLKNEWYSAPTQSLAMKWLREVHNILLVVDYDYEFTSTSYIYKIYRLVENGRPERVIVKGTSYDKDNNPTEHIVSSRDYERSAEEYATYQQAAEAGIRYCLESLT